MVALPSMDACRMRRGTNMVAWLSVPYSIFNRTDLGDQEWCNSLFLLYAIHPLDLPPNFDGFGGGI